MLNCSLPGSITVDVCWHRGRVVVARHSPPQLVVESFAPDLTGVQALLVLETGGNAAARVVSWRDALWLLYRDSADRGHLLQVGTPTRFDLGLAYGQRPFAFGPDGYGAYLCDAQHARIRALDAPHVDASTQAFPDPVPTGLSHLEGSVAVSWDSMRSIASWGLCFVCSGPVEFAQSFNDDGLLGRLDGNTTHEWSLWRDALINDQRIAVQGDCCAVIGWIPGQAARLGMVTQTDLVPISMTPPKPDPIPLDQVIPLQGKWICAWYEQKGPPELLQPPQPLPPGNMEIAVYTANYPPGCVRPRPVIAMLDGYERIAPSYLVRLGSEGRHDAEGLKKLEQLAWDLADQGVQTAVYWDARELPFWPSLPPDCIWEQVAYCGCDEALTDFEHFLEARSQEALARYRYLLICAQTHTTNDSLLAEPSRAIPPVERVLRRRRAEVGERMAGLSVFNNSGRDDPNTGEGGLTANPQLRPHWERLFSGVTGLPEVFSHAGNGGNGDTAVQIEIFDFPTHAKRSDRKGLPISFDITAERPILKIELGLLDGAGHAIESALMPKFDPPDQESDKDGRYVRTLAWKPVREGVFTAYVKAWDDAGGVGECRSPHTVEVTA